MSWFQPILLKDAIGLAGTLLCLGVWAGYALAMLVNGGYAKPVDRTPEPVPQGPQSPEPELPPVEPEPVPDGGPEQGCDCNMVAYKCPCENRNCPMKPKCNASL